MPIAEEYGIKCKLTLLFDAELIVFITEFVYKVILLPKKDAVFNVE